MLAIVGLAGAGVWTIWGADLRRLVRPDEGQAAEAPPPEQPAVAAPAGQAAGPF